LVEVASGQQGIGHDLQAAAMSQQADLLVMGAYGHSRLREFVLGGATSGVLNQTSLPVLMSR
jgi:nucleotide-binding universal stress UspA family protein